MDHKEGYTLLMEYTLSSPELPGRYSGDVKAETLPDNQGDSRWDIFMDNDSEYEPESGDSSDDSDANDMDFVLQLKLLILNHRPWKYLIVNLSDRDTLRPYLGYLCQIWLILYVWLWHWWHIVTFCKISETKLI